MKRFSLHIRAAALLTAFVLLPLTGCGGSDPAPEPAAAPTASTPAATPDAPAPATLSGTVADGVRTLRITPVGNEMKFEQAELAVEAGETVRVVFENTATSPAMQHNVVFVTGADVVNRVGLAALEVGGDYVPEDEAVRWATPLAQPGETVEVTFTVPDTPGTYLYICTFPGHYMMMQGTLFVKAPASV